MVCTWSPLFELLDIREFGCLRYGSLASVLRLGRRRVSMIGLKVELFGGFADCVRHLHGHCGCRTRLAVVAGSMSAFVGRLIERNLDQSSGTRRQTSTR